jgi:hypothetical protein
MCIAKPNASTITDPIVLEADKTLPWELARASALHRAIPGQLRIEMLATLLAASKPQSGIE